MQTIPLPWVLSAHRLGGPKFNSWSHNQLIFIAQKFITFEMTRKVVHNYLLLTSLGLSLFCATVIDSSAGVLSSAADVTGCLSCFIKSGIEKL